MNVTETLRSVVAESRSTHYAIQQATGINARAIDRFMDGTDVRGMTIDKLCEYFGLELCQKKGRTAPKQPAKKPATNRKRSAKKK